MRKIIAPFLILLLPGLPSAQTAATSSASSLAFTRVTVIDVKGARAQSDMTVIVAGSRIAAVGKTGRVRVPDGARIVEAGGKFLIPGLWDMHVHVFNNGSNPGTNNKDYYFPLLVANGVTGVRDMWSDPEDLELLRRWRQEFEAGTLVAPRVAPGSSIVDGVPTYIPNALGVSTPDEARRAVRTMKEAGAGFIKIYWNLTPEAYRAIADESKKLGIPFAGHVPFSIGAGEASDAGQKSIEHLTGLWETCSSKEEELRKAKGLAPQELTAELWRTYDQSKCRALFSRFARNGTWHVPTVAIHRMLTFRRDENFRKDDRLRYIPADEVRDWLAPPRGVDRFSPETRRARFEKMLETIGLMHRAGVPLLAGTDVGNPFIYPGFSLHDELDAFVRAGLTPLQALQTATLNPARYFGMTRSLGTVEKGKLADLVLLDANPLADISNTKRINAVVLNGRLFDRNALDKMLADAESAVNKK